MKEYTFMQQTLQKEKGKQEMTWIDKELKYDICIYLENCQKYLSEIDFIKAVFCDEVVEIIFNVLKAKNKDCTVSCLVLIGEIVAIKGADVQMKYLKDYKLAD